MANYLSSYHFGGFEVPFYHWASVPLVGSKPKVPFVGTVPFADEEARPPYGLRLNRLALREFSRTVGGGVA